MGRLAFLQVFPDSIKITYYFLVYYLGAVVSPEITDQDRKAMKECSFYIIFKS